MKSACIRLSKGIASLAILAVVVSLVGGCVSINHLPVITSLEAKCEVVAPLEICLIECVAADEDGDELSYEWLSREGDIEGDGATVAWEAPESGGIYEIVVRVSDGNGSKVTDSINVTVRVNNPPIITALTADSNWVHPSSSCQLRCDCGDADGDELMYEWSSEGGDISGEGPEVTWTAPDSMGTYTITVVVTDGLGGESSSALSIDVGPNHPPVIEELIITPEADRYFNPTKMKILQGKSCDIECIASDPDGDQLSYQWSADVPPDGYWTAAGSISGEGSSVTWAAPSRLSEVAVTVTVSDGRGGTDTKSITFHVVTCECVLNK